MRSYRVIENDMIEAAAGNAAANRSRVEAAALRRLKIRTTVTVLPDLHLRRDLL